jgi:hypothetical protein
VFTGVTEATADGTVVTEDPDDWCFGDSGESHQLFGYPNPFTMSTKVAYSMPEAGHARIRIMAQGCLEVRTLLDSDVEAGTSGFVLWDRRADSGSRVRPGIYRCWFEVDGELVCHGDLQVVGE